MVRSQWPNVQLAMRLYCVDGRSALDMVPVHTSVRRQQLVRQTTAVASSIGMPATMRTSDKDLTHDVNNKLDANERNLEVWDGGRIQSSPLLGRKLPHPISVASSSFSSWLPGCCTNSSSVSLSLSYFFVVGHFCMLRPRYSCPPCPSLGVIFLHSSFFPLLHCCFQTGSFNDKIYAGCTMSMHCTIATRRKLLSNALIHC